MSSLMLIVYDIENNLSSKNEQITTPYINIVDEYIKKAAKTINNKENWTQNDYDTISQLKQRPKILENKIIELISLDKNQLLYFSVEPYSINFELKLSKEDNHGLKISTNIINRNTAASLL